MWLIFTKSKLFGKHFLVDSIVRLPLKKKQNFPNVQNIQLDYDYERIEQRSHSNFQYNYVHICKLMEFSFFF